MKLVFCGVMLIGLSRLALASEALVSVSFARNKWDPKAWVLARNPLVPHLGKWVQRETAIENETPADPAKKSSLSDTLTTMIYGKKFAGDYTVTATFDIGPGAAPGIVLALDWAPDSENQPQYGEFYEVIIYEKGINLWHNFAKGGKHLYEKSVYEAFPLKANTPYKLEVRKKGKTLEMSVDGHQLGVFIPSLPEELSIGVEGCEGVCRVSDFTVTR